MGSGGSFVAILLSIPLTAVALVGVVGVPKLQEILSSATSSHGDDEFDEDSFSPRSRSKRGSSRGDHGKEEDAALWGDDSELNDGFSDNLGTKKPSKGRSSTLARNSKSKPADDGFGSDLKEESDDFFRKPRSGSGSKATETAEMYATEPFKARSHVLQAEHVTPAQTPRATGRPDNFAAAIEKLRGMGVDRFHLEPGLGAGQFLFVCQVEGTGESATIHRFEAESSDPAAAVADVTKQLSEWQAESSVTRTAGAEFRR